MFCPNCGNKLNGNEEFCPFCGKNVKELSFSNQEEKKQDNIQSFQSVNKININTNNTNNVKSLNKSKRDFLIIIVIIAIVVIGIIISVIAIVNIFNKNDKYGNTSGDNTISIVRDENGIAKFINGKFTDISVKSEDDAYDALDTLKDELKFKNVKDEFTIESTDISEDVTYYRFHQKYKDTEIYGINLIISVDKNGKVLSMSGYYIPNIDIDVNAKNSKEEAETLVKQNLGNNNVKIVSSNKYIYADNTYKNLVYIIDAYSDEKIMEYIIDANTNEIIDSNEVMQYAAYKTTINGLKGQVNVTVEKFYDTVMLRDRYYLVDSTRNIEIVDGSNIGTDLAGVAISSLFSSWNPMSGDLENGNFIYFTAEGENKELAKIGVSTLKNFEDIYDYYYTILGRKSYDNKGGKIVVNVGMRDKTFGGEEFENAAWLSLNNQMYIGYYNGKSFGSVKDVLAHEMTHGVISKTSRFAGSPKREEREKAFETGALDEGIADILGSLIEGKNWTIDEDISVIRSLSNPNAYDNPSEKGGKYYYPDGYLSDNRTLEKFLKDNNLSSVSDYDGGGVHQNSTVPSHAAYLMYKNGAFNSMEEEAKVWYNALFLMSSYSNFEDCALAVIQSARNLGLSSNSISIIEEAFMETKMLEDKRIEISGTVSSGDSLLSDVKIELKEKNSENSNYTFTTDKDGKFTGKIESGTYEITFTKEGFEIYKKTITIHGDTTIDVELKSIKKQSSGLTCKSGNCHTLTIYFLSSMNNTGLYENYETCSVDDGAVIDINVLVKTINDTFGGNILQTDGKTFKISVEGYTTDFAWYYKDTNTKFDFNTPITEDIEIEMKLFDGVIDNDYLKDIYDLFNK